MKTVLFLMFFFIGLKLTGQSIDEYAYFLSKYVSESGDVNYKGILLEKDRYDKMLKVFSDNPPKKNENSKVALAYWINTYNAFTIKLIIDHYPVKSITELHPFFYIPGFNTVWHEEFFQIGGEDFDLDRIEHEILRKEFDEPRIHFAINCASESCPALLNRAYEGKLIEEQLEFQSRRFINDPTKNKITKDKLELSKIFSWFEGDFDEFGGVLEFVKKYSDKSFAEKPDISYLPYDWKLNE